MTYTWGHGRARRVACVVATPDHPVLRLDGRWKALTDLQPGDRLRALHRCYSHQGSRQRLYASISPDARRSSYVHEHRYIMQCLRGPLDPQWHVDHVDNDPLNNTIDNLHYLPHPKHSQKCARESWDALGRQRKLEGFRAAWSGARGQERRRKIQERLAQQRRQADELNHRVVEVRFHGYADVYTMEVDAGDNGVANGIVVHSRVGEVAEG